MFTNLQTAYPPEEVVVVEDREVGLKGIIILHSRTLGPAAGGCRLWSYASDEDRLTDAMRLAQGMTFKNALAGLPLGGGKAVLQMPDGTFDRKRFFEAFGRAINKLEGRYVTAEDVGTSVDDMRAVAHSTRHVAGLPQVGPRPGGDPSPHTARGVLAAMEVAAERKLGRSIGECTVAVQGLGHVGHVLAQLLHAKGAKLIVAERNAQVAAKFVVETGAELAHVNAIYSASADIFAPCAMGATLNEQTISQLRAKIVCGAANNQLATDADSLRLADRDILYAPDFAVNAGGIINVAGEYLGWAADEVERRVMETGLRLDKVLDYADTNGIFPHDAAEALAQQTTEMRPLNQPLCDVA